MLVSDMEYVHSEQKITKAKLASGNKEVLAQTLEEMEQQLDPKLLFRANRQFIVQIDAIRQVHNYFNGKLKIELKRNPEVEIIVSRDKASCAEELDGFHKFPGSPVSLPPGKISRFI